MTPAEGKTLVHAMLMGAAPPFEHAQSPACQSLERIAPILRWVACNALPDVHETLLRADERECRWPEASLASHLWQGVEDHVLSSMRQFAAARHCSHLSLHFDGIRIDRAAALDGDA